MQLLLVLLSMVVVRLVRVQGSRRCSGDCAASSDRECVCSSNNININNDNNNNSINNNNNSPVP